MGNLHRDLNDRADRTTIEPVCNHAHFIRKIDNEPIVVAQLSTTMFGLPNFIWPRGSPSRPAQLVAPAKLSPGFRQVMLVSSFGFTQARHVAIYARRYNTRWRLKRARLLVVSVLLPSQVMLLTVVRCFFSHFVLQYISSEGPAVRRPL